MIGGGKVLKADARAYVYLVATTSIWGSLYVVTRIALRTIPPMTLLFLRYALAAAALAGLREGKRRRGAPAPRVDPADRRLLVLVGALGYFLGVGAQVYGTKYAGASVASLINAMNPVCITFAAALALGERLTPRKIAALAAAVLGAVAVLGGAGSPGAGIGIALSILSVVLWSLSSVAVRSLGAKYDPIDVTAWGIGIAGVCALPAAAVELAAVRPEGLLSWTNLASVLYLGTVCTALPNVLWNKSLSMLEASTCSLFYPIQPLVSVLLGVAILGEAVGPRFFVGAALIVGGVLFAVAAPGRRGKGEA